jgi:hypothetical protein
MIVDEVLEILLAKPRGGGDACLGKGETWKFQQSKFTRLGGIGQFLARYENRKPPYDEYNLNETGQIQAWVCIRK